MFHLNDMSLSELRMLLSLVLRGTEDAAEDVDDFLLTASSVALFVTFTSFSSWAFFCHSCQTFSKFQPGFVFVHPSRLPL